MSASENCSRCSRPLTADSVGGVCTSCRSGETSRRTPPAPDPAAVESDGLEAAAFQQGKTRSHPAADHDAPTASLHATQPRPRAPAMPAGYELVRRLGHGGMGQVYLARDVVAERLVAVKFLAAAHNPAVVERFLVEVRALTRADHPHILGVFGHDFHAPVPFFTMEYAPGGSLADRLNRGGPLAPAEAARLTAVAARAVHAAHAAGVLHRDLKPSNILLAADGSVRLADFGLAKRTDVDDGLSSGSGPLGTLAYMPPEQTRRGDVDGRADVYGLGATLYHLLTGRPPFVGPEPDVLAAVVSTPPRRPRAIRPEIPMGLEAVVMKCLEKRPQDRYPTAAALADDLEACAAGCDPGAPRLTLSRRVRRWVRWHRVRLAVAAAAVLAGVGLVAAGKLLAPIPKPEVKTDPLAEIRRDLAAGRPVTLLGATGRPRYHRWALEEGEFVETGDGTFAFLNRPETLLELCPDPGIDRYRIAAELRQLDTTARRGGENFTAYSVGLYFGYDLQTSPEGTRLHVFSSVRAADYRPDRAGQPELKYFDHLIVQPQLVGAGGKMVEVAHRPCDAAADLPGPWRRFEVEVGPDSVRVDFGHPAARPAVHDAAGLRDRVGELQKALSSQSFAGFAPGARVPDWSPRRPLGVRVHGASVAVRNVVITPLPRPEN